MNLMSCEFKTKNGGCSLLPVNEETHKSYPFLDKSKVLDDCYCCGAGNHNHIIDMKSVRWTMKRKDGIDEKISDNLALEVLKICKSGHDENLKSGSQDKIIPSTLEALTRAIEITEEN